MTDDVILLDREDGVATITLNDPDRRNAYTLQMKRALLKTLNGLNDDPPRCIVIEGAGDAFCAGGDIDRMEERLHSDKHVTVDDVRTTLGLSNAIITKLVRSPTPVISKIDGPAVGGGASLAIAADIKLVSERAKIGFGFQRIGLSLDGGASFLLPRLVGVGTAKELAFTGRLVGGEEAQKLGLVNHVFSSDAFEEDADAFISQIGGGPTVALRQIKRLLTEGPQKTLEQALEDELLAQSIVSNTHDHHEGVRAFLEDREPKFTGE